MVGFIPVFSFEQFNRVSNQQHSLQSHSSLVSSPFYIETQKSFSAQEVNAITRFLLNHTDFDISGSGHTLAEG